MTWTPSLRPPWSEWLTNLMLRDATAVLAPEEPPNTPPRPTPPAARPRGRHCREYMICPLPRANDLTAPSRQPGCHAHRGGGDDLHPGCSGAGREGAR